MHVIVTGSRHASRDQPQHTRPIWQALLAIHREQPGPHRLAYGNAPGADDIAAAYAQHLGWAVRPFPARWEGPCRDTCQTGHRRQYIACPRGGEGTYCPAAGNYRNQDMIDATLPYLPDVVCLAFPLPNSRGTHDCVARAEKAGITVHLFPLPDLPAPAPIHPAGATRP